jgi:hypothetical protein
MGSIIASQQQQHRKTVDVDRRRFEKVSRSGNCFPFLASVLQQIELQPLSRRLSIDRPSPS